MTSMPSAVLSAISADAFRCVFNSPRRRSKLGVLFVVLAVLLCGAAKNASAQTAHLSGSTLASWAQTTLGSGFNFPAGVAVDGSGNVYVADLENNAVKEILAVNGSIPASPVIRTLGSGFSRPGFVAVDGNGDVFVSDSGNQAFKEIVAVNGSIPASPSIVTLGTSSAPEGIAVDGEGNVYAVSGTPAGTMLAVSGVTSQSAPQNGTNSAGVAAGSLSIPAFSAGVNEILAVNGSIPTTPVYRTLISSSGLGFVAVDSHENVYLTVGCGQSTISNVACGGVVELAAVNGSIPTSPDITNLGSGFSFPTGVAVDASGNVFVANDGNGTVQELVAVNGSIPTSPTINTLGSGFNFPAGVAVDGYGNVYVDDAENNRVEMLSLSGSNFGSVNIGAASSTQTLTFTFDTAGTLGSIAVLTQGASGLDFVNAGTGTCAANTAYIAGQSCTVNVAFTPRFAGTRNGAAVLYDSTGDAIATGNLQGSGVGPQVNFLPGIESTYSTGSAEPTSLAMDGNGNIYYTEANSSALIEMLAVNGVVPASPTVRIVASGFGSASSLTLDASGNLYVADTTDNAVKEVLAVNGSIPASPTVRILGSGFSYPSSVAVDGAGNVYVTGLDNTVKEMLAVDGTIPDAPSIRTLDSSDSGLMGVAVDASGNVYVGDSFNNVVVELLAVNGSIPTSPAIKILGSGFSHPVGVAVDSNGDVYVADSGNNAIKELVAVNGSIPTSPTINTLGSGFSGPGAVVLDGSGNLYVPDCGNNRIVKLDFADAPSLTFASTAIGSISADSPQTVTVANVGNAALSFPASSAGNNPSIAANFTLNSSAAWACPLVPSDSSTPGTLAAGASCQLAIGFTPTAAGALSGSLVLTDNHLNAAGPSFATQTISLTGTATQATPTITWATPAAITYGTQLSATQLNAASTVAGTFAYSPAAGSVLTAGSQTLTVTFTPTDTNDYTSASATVALTVNMSTPAIAWATPAAIAYGTQLSATQLNATSTLAGTFTYSPAAGSVLTAGQQPLAVTFTPTDATDYTSATASVSLTVNKATPTVTWATPTAITYGTALSGTQLNAASTVAGTFAYSPAAGSVLTAGQQPLAVTFTPTDATDYTSATAGVSLTVNKATPTVTWATPTAITYGTALSGTQLNASSAVAGSFSYSPAAGTVPNAGSQTLTVTLTPADNADYNAATASVKLTVNKATLSIAWATPAAIAYGTALSATQLDATSTALGTFSYSPAAGTVLAVGSHPLTVTLTPTNAANYTATTATKTVTLTVNKATPAITWATPVAISYGTALSAAQLDATSDVAGTFTYSPAAKTVLAAGQQTLKVTFTPTNGTDYTTATASVTLTVNKLVPTIAWATPKTIVYGTALSGTQLNASSTISGTFVYSPAAGTVPTGGTHTLSVTFTPTNTTDYSTTTDNLSITVSQASPTVKVTSSASSIVSGNSVTFTATATGAGAKPTGSVAFLDGTTQLASDPLNGSGVTTFSTTKLAVGKHTITANYSGDGNYAKANSTSITVTVTAH